MLYFSQSPVDPEKIDIDQFTVMRSFKEKMRLKGLTESYSGIPDFRQKFSRQLAINLNSILTQVATALTDQRQTATKAKSPKSVVPAPLDLLFVADSAASLTPDHINEYLVKAVTSVAGSDGWADVAAVGNFLKIYTPIDYHVLGFNKLNKFLESTKLFETKVAQKSARAKAVDVAYVRLVKRP